MGKKKGGKQSKRRTLGTDGRGYNTGAQQPSKTKNDDHQRLTKTRTQVTPIPHRDQSGAGGGALDAIRLDFDLEVQHCAGDLSGGCLSLLSRHCRSHIHRYSRGVGVGFDSTGAPPIATAATIGGYR